MTPVILSNGRSFKGAAAYYLHDRGKAATAERVAWAETVNLQTADPERAWRMMADTAMSQAELKLAAGVKATGRKLNAPVFTYVLSWHEQDRPTDQDMREAARETLKRLGMNDRQAIIVRHTDTANPHVHVMVNRVSPETGVAAGLSNSKTILQDWALEYQRARGQTHCPAREENRKRREQGETVRAPRKPRAPFEAERDTGNDNLAGEFVKTEQRQKDAALYERGRQLRSSHARQWGELNRTYGVVQGRLQTATQGLKDAKSAEIKDQAKGRWRDLFRQQKEDRATFEAAERGFLSRLWSMAFVFHAIRQQDPQADALTILYTLLSSSQRRHTFEVVQEAERRDLAKQIKQEIGAAGRRIDKEQGRGFAKLRAAYLSQCGTLRETQAKQRTELSATWDSRNAERKQAMAPFRQRAARMRQGGQDARQRQARSRSIRADDQARRQQPPKKPPEPGLG